MHMKQNSVAVAVFSIYVPNDVGLPLIPSHKIQNIYLFRSQFREEVTKVQMSLFHKSQAASLFRCIQLLLFNANT